MATRIPVLSPAEAVDAADAHPFVARVKEFAGQVLRPDALRTEQAGVTPERVEQLRALGLLNHLAPAPLGGPEAIDRAADRRLHEILAGACLNTWLVWAQHAPLVGQLATRVAAGEPLSPLGEQVLRGDRLIGAAISDVRRYPDHYVVARRTGDGWTVSGTVSWVSGWGLNSALTVAAVDPRTETVVTALAGIGDRVRAVPLDLSAVRGSRTERVVLEEVFVPDVDVISTRPLSDWRTADLAAAGDTRPHHFGLAATVLDELRRERHPLAVGVATTWAPRVARIRADAYRLADAAAAVVADGGDGRHRLDERLATKVASGEALSTLTRALLVSRSGHGLTADDTAQLHARSALFLLVQGQNADVREAQLATLAR